MTILNWFRRNKTRKKTRVGSVYRQTVMKTFQGQDGTCYAHLGARLIIQNILKMKDEEKQLDHWKYRSMCRKMLNTYKPPTPPPDLKQCGVQGFLKISMFLYLYYLITERFGLDGGSLNQCMSIYPMVKQVQRPLHFTPEYNGMYTAISNVKSTTPFYVNHVFLSDDPLEDESNSLVVQLVLLFLRHDMYIGCRYYSNNNPSEGHLFAIVGYSASKKSFYVKNPWETYVSLLAISDIGKSRVTFEGQRMTARVNMFAFVYTRRPPKPQWVFDKVTPDILQEFKEEFGDVSDPFSRNPLAKKRAKA